MVTESMMIPVYINPQDEPNTSKTFDREGHGFAEEENRVDFYKNV